jgi:hypothetical protein
MAYRVISAQSGGVVNASGTNRPPDAPGLTNDASRRTFLKGVGLVGAAGLAGAAGLTSPFLATTSARAASVGIILGAQAGPTSPWNGDGATPWPVAVPGAQGCRSYRDTAFTTVDEAHSVLGNPPVFPGEQGSIPLASIRPNPTALLNGDLDGVIKDMILDGANKATGTNPHFAGTPQLTVWHEAGHLGQESTNSPYYKNGLFPDQINGIPTSGPHARTARLMHIKMQNLVKDVNNAHTNLTNVAYGCIIYGDVNKMANDLNDPQGPTNWIPTAATGSGASADGALDWYGIDIYYEDDGAGSDCTHGTLDTYDKVKSHLDNFLATANRRVPSGKPLRINICECNANVTDDGARPQYFENLAIWLYNNPGYRMLTFFPDPAGNHSVTWPHVADANPAYTIDRLNYIQTHYGR